MRAVLYAAKSTEDKHGSIPDQLRECREMAERELWLVEAEFSDEGFSAYSGNRGPGLLRARETAARVAEEDREAVLVVWASDRLARGAGDAPGAASHLAELWFAIRRSGVTVRAVKDDHTFMNPMMVAAMGERAYEDSRLKSERVKQGARRRAERGKHHGGPRPFGFRYVLDEDGKRALAIKESEAAIVRRVYQEFIAGKSQRQIARDLVRDGVPTQRGAEWSQPIIAKVLRGELYAGRVRLNGQVYASEHVPAIVDEETWQRAQALRSARARTTGHGGGRPPATAFLFTRGRLRCHCGAAMVPRTIRPRSKTGKWYEAYLCHARVKDVNACDQTPLQRGAVDSAMLRFFEERVLDIEETRRQLAGAVGRQLDEVRALLGQAEAELQRLDASRKRVERDYLAGDLPATLYAGHVEGLETDQTAAEAEVARLRAREAEVAEMTAFELDDETMTDVLAHLRAAVTVGVETPSVESLRAAIDVLFDRVVLEKIPDVWVPIAIEHVHADLWLFPRIREEYVLGRTASGRQEIAKIPLNQAANNANIGRTT